MNDFILFQIKAMLLTIRSNGSGSAYGGEALLRFHGYVDALFHLGVITAECASALDSLAKNAGLALYSRIGRDWAV